MARVSDQREHGADRALRLFGSSSFLRLWLAQVASSLGDWIGFVAITAIASRVAGGSPEAAVAFVLSARLIPGFFLAPVAGVLVDRFNRKRVMVLCDIGRGLTFATLPFVQTVPGLVVASFVLELLTLLWAPAKEASVPHLVPSDRLATANSLSLVAAYGTFPVASALFAALAGVARMFSDFDDVGGVAVDREFVAVYVNVATFFVAAALIATLRLPKAAPAEQSVAEDGRSPSRLRATWREVGEGLTFIRQSPVVRSVNLAVATGLIGGGMLVPLGPTFASENLGGGSAAFGLLLTALGSGMAAGIAAVSLMQRRIPLAGSFVVAVFLAGGSIIAGASMSSLRIAILFVAMLGVSAGAVYVLGFTILQTEVADQLRGRIFATFNALVRFCLLIAFTVAPLLASVLDNLSEALVDRDLTIGGATIHVPGNRLTLWLGGVIILGAGVIALLSLRSGRRDRVGPPQPPLPS